MSDDPLFAYDELFRLAVCNSTIPKSIQNKSGCLLVVNEAFAELVGYPDVELLGRNPDDFLVSLDPASQQRRPGCRPAKTLPGTSTRYRELIHRNGRQIPVRVDLSPAIARDGSEVLACAWIDVSSKRTAVERALQQQDTLVNEVHHRVKNDLQALSGLLILECDKQPNLEPTLKKVIAQISAVASLHGLHFEQGDRVDPVRLIESMAASIADTWERRIVWCVDDTARGRFTIAEDTERLPFALIINELLTNALKHSTTPATLPINISVVENSLSVRIGNPGHIAHAARLNGLAKPSSGLGLVRSLRPDRGMDISYDNQGQSVFTTVRLSAPLLTRAATKANELPVYPSSQRDNDDPAEAAMRGKASCDR